MYKLQLQFMHQKVTFGANLAGSSNSVFYPPPKFVQGCQMAIARFLDRMCLALRASGLWLRYATLQNLIPSFPWIAPPRPPSWCNPRKGRNQILRSGNLVLRMMFDKLAHASIMRLNAQSMDKVGTLVGGKFKF